jgi:endonuclease YncB( thermonuclease family)
MSTQAVSGILAAAILGCSIAALAVPDALSQGTIAGEARVVDGDSLVVAGQRVRLSGIDAPELHQMCGEVHCGLFAKQVLTDAIGGSLVRCSVEGHDKYQRALATCGTADAPDLGGLMVAKGAALAYRRYSTKYADHEEAAKAEKLGIWRTSGFVSPEDWRHGKR